MFFAVFERGIFGMFVVIIILLLIIAKPLQKFIDYLDAHLTYHEPYRKKDGEEYGEKFHERVWLLFWTYFVFSWLLAGSLYLTQIGFTISIANIQIGFSGYTYLIEAILIVFLARAIATTSFVNEKYRIEIAPKFFTTVFGLAALGSFLSLINLLILWVYNPQKIYNLLQVPIPLPQGSYFLRCTTKFVLNSWSSCVFCEYWGDNNKSFLQSLRL